MMNEQEKQAILDKAKIWWEDSISKRHIANTRKLVSAKEFNINPFTAIYLANFLTGNGDTKSIAKALIYPRVLGTSIGTSFGNAIQQFTSNVLSAYGSTTHGIDIEYIDNIDGRKKYCQLKSGPNTINKDDVDTIVGHFTAIKNLARTNNLLITDNDLVVGVVYGETEELSGHYKRIDRDHHPVIIGQDFWHRLTGDANFYNELIAAIASVAQNADFQKELEDVISELSKDKDIIALARSINI